LRLAVARNHITIRAKDIRQRCQSSKAGSIVRSSDAQAGAAAEPVAAVPLEVRGRFLTAVVLPVSGAVDDAFYARLDALLRKSPHFFADAPLVLDVERAALETQDDFGTLLGHLRARKLTPIGIQNASAGQSAGAAGAGLTTLPAGRVTPLPSKPRPALAAAKPAAPAAHPPENLLITEPVRSGQRIVAEHGDLVVVASVGSGAELIASGNVHVYGRLRGRALAGVNGDRTARIFCQSLEAELIAIAGLYKTSDKLGPDVTGKRVQVFLQDESLRIEALK
jgi:septum site-determining protein MinC